MRKAYAMRDAYAAEQRYDLDRIHDDPKRGEEHRHLRPRSEQPE